MREIKFRAWDKKNKKMISHEKLFSIDCSNEFPFLPLLKNMYSENLDVEIMQYTGMNDSTGKEIYEGDIVKTNYDDVGVVAMGEHNGVNGSEAFNIGFYIIWDSFDDRSWMRNELLYFIKKIGVTVIGNRWDNPELLGGVASD